VQLYLIFYAIQQNGGLLNVLLHRIELINSVYFIGSFLMAMKNQGSAPRALVVDDMKLDHIVVLAMLRKLEREITVAHNGREAVDLFLEGKTFDIFFCDKDMPVMTGPQVLQSQFIYFISGPCSVCTLM
jgi:hypothetical protein